MHWLFLLLALGCFAIVFKTTSMGLAAVCLLAALGFVLAWVAGLVNARISRNARDAVHIASPAELRALRERGTAKPSPPPGEPPAAR